MNQCRAVKEAGQAASAQMEFYKEMMNFKPHEQRVIDEKSALDIKLEALKSFIHTSDMYLTLDKDERSRLFRQELYMQQYSDVLRERIQCFTETN